MLKLQDGPLGRQCALLRLSFASWLVVAAALLGSGPALAQPPVFTSQPVTSVHYPENYVYEVTVSGTGEEPLEIGSNESLPAWLMLIDHGAGTATLSGTPTAAHVGQTFEVTLGATQGGFARLQQFQISVTADPPTITMNGAATMEIAQTTTTFTDPGATAVDFDGTSLSVTYSGSVDTTTPGEYTLSYSATDRANQTNSVGRTVIVTPVAPTISLNGEATMEVLQRQGPPFSDPGATATDFAGTDISGSIQVSGSVNVRTPGDYTLTYEVSDAHGTPAQPVTRIVTVLPDNPPVITLLGDDPLRILQGQTFVDPGATANDPEDGDLTDEIQVSGGVDTGIPGDYTRTYTVTDSNGNTVTATRTVTVAPNNPPTITLLGDDPMSVLQNTSFQDPGATADDPEDGDLTGAIEVSGEVDIGTPGDYSLTYSVTDSDDNTATAERTVTVTPNTLPTITLLGDDPLVTLHNRPFQDPGATADDAEDGDLTGEIEVEGSVDTTAQGEYTLTYSVTDSDGNAVSVARTVVVASNNPPTITLLGSNPLNIAQGGEFADPGATAHDEEDGDLTDRLETTGSVDTNEPGSYTITYSVTDSDGNSVSASRTVVVRNNPPELIEPIAAPNATESAPYEAVNDGGGFSLANFFSDPDGDSLYFEVNVGPWPVGLPESGNLQVDSDGSRTGVRGLVYGTPTLEDTSDDGPRVVTVKVRDRADPNDPHVRVIEETFELTIEALGRTDISLTIDATPNPAPVQADVTWEFTIANSSQSAAADEVELEAVFAGLPFSFIDIGNCASSGQRLTCIVGPVPARGSVTVAVTGRPAQAGDIAVNASAFISQVTGFEPIDPNPNNNSAMATLNVGESFSSGPAHSLSAPSASRGIAAGDINGNGYTDVVLATGAGHATRIYFSVPTDPDDPAGEEFRRLSTSPIMLDDDDTDARDVLLVDLNNDSVLDLVIANGVFDGAPQTNKIFFNHGVDGQANFSLAQTLGNGISHAVTAADLNGNGFMDLVFANDGPNEVFINQGNGTFTLHATLGDSDSRAVVAIDLDGNLLPDIVFANGDGPSQIYRNLGDGTFGDPVSIVQAPMISVQAGDFNGDALLDLVFGHPAAGAELPSNPVYINTSTPGSISFVPSTSALGGSPTAKVMIHDLNLDGIADIIALNTTGTHQIYRGAENTAFTLQPQQFSSATPAGGAVGDFNNNGRPDLVVSRNGGVDVFLNDGLGNLGPGDTTPPVIQLLGETAVTVGIGNAYADAGATAWDSVDGDLTDRIVIDDPVDSAVIGTYTVRYTVRDLSGNAAVPVTRTVTVQARENPTGGGGGAMGLLFMICLMLLLVCGQAHRSPRGLQLLLGLTRAPKP